MPHCSCFFKTKSKIYNLVKKISFFKFVLIVFFKCSIFKSNLSSQIRPINTEICIILLQEFPKQAFYDLGYALDYD